MYNVYLYILVAGLVSTLIRVLPALFIKKKIENIYVQSFLYYLPYVTLAVMTFPAILHCTDHVLSGLFALAVGTILAWKSENLFLVAVASCIAVFLAECLYMIF